MRSVNMIRSRGRFYLIEIRKYDRSEADTIWKISVHSSRRLDKKLRKGTWTEKVGDESMIVPCAHNTGSNKNGRIEKCR